MDNRAINRFSLIYEQDLFGTEQDLFGRFFYKNHRLASFRTDRTGKTQNSLRARARESLKVDAEKIDQVNRKVCSVCSEWLKALYSKGFRPNKSCSSVCSVCSLLFGGVNP